MKREDMPYRDCVGAAVFNRDGRVFVGRRKPDKMLEDASEVAAPWQMPQGGIDKGEEPYAAALRELFEETSIRSVEPVAEVPGWIYYDLPDEALGILPDLIVPFKREAYQQIVAALADIPARIRAG